MKQDGINDPDKIIDATDIQEDLSSLSVEAIQRLIESTKKKDNPAKEEKDGIIEEINEMNHNALTIEELNHLKSLPTSELLIILEETTKVVEEKALQGTEYVDSTIISLKNKLKATKGDK